MRAAIGKSGFFVNFEQKIFHHGANSALEREQSKDIIRSSKPDFA